MGRRRGKRGRVRSAEKGKDGTTIEIGHQDGGNSRRGLGLTGLNDETSFESNLVSDLFGKFSGCYTKSVYKSNSRTPALGLLTNLMIHLTARSVDDYCSITVVNHELITVIRFVVKNYTHL